MFRLRDLKNGLFQIHKTQGGAFEGTPKLIFRTATKMGVNPQSIFTAVCQLQQNKHDYAEFNSKGLFVGTKKDSK